MRKLLPFTIVNRAGTGVTVYAADSTAAVLARCTQLAEAAELAARQGIRGRRLDWRALPASVEAGEVAVATVSDLYGCGEGVRTYRVPSDTVEGRVYTVTLADEFAKCECRGFIWGSKPCKHVRRARELEVSTR